MSRVIELTKDLIARPSVTPNDSGCQQKLAELLTPLGFHCEHLHFGEVDNLWARRGAAAPLFVFLGHTDVVPTGPLTKWDHPPFSPLVKEGFIYGRGASDMKGSVAAFIVAIENFLKSFAEHKGSIALMLTSDEEGPSVDGVKKVIEVLEQRNEKINYCITGEPTCEEVFGDIIKIGRRGSLTGNLIIYGKQGHAAFPHMTENPIHRIAPTLKKLAEEIWDQGNQNFPPTSFQMVNIQAGTGAANIVPGELYLQFNFRYCPESTAENLKNRVEAYLQQDNLRYEIQWELGGLPFLTEGGKLRQAAIKVVREVTGIEPQCSTVGGTSDARFVAPTGAEVLEFGPRTTAHQINECVPLEDLEKLVMVYEKILEKLLS